MTNNLEHTPPNGQVEMVSVLIILSMLESSMPTIDQFLKGLVQVKRQLLKRSTSQ